MKRVLGLALLAWLPSCGSSSPVNVAGDYTINITNGPNGCNFQNYTVGQSNSGIMVSLTQQGSSASADVTGGSGLVLDAVLGGHVFTGSVSGDSFDLTLDGTHATTTGNCTYTYNGAIHGSLMTDTITGTLDYAAATNNNSDCASIQGCTTSQDFNGTRPP